MNGAGIGIETGFFFLYATYIFSDAELAELRDRGYAMLISSIMILHYSINNLIECFRQELKGL